jgi:hypothetical protein
MSTDINEADVVTQEVATEAPALAPAEAGSETHEESPSAAQAAQVSPETERKARDMGWVPQTEWRGSPDAWRPADQFVKRGEEVLPIVRSNLERERRKVQELESTVRDLPSKIRAEVEQSYAERFKRLEGMSRLALEKQREKIWHDFEEKKRAAVADGNMQAYDTYNQEQRRALSEFHAETEVEEPEPPARQNGAPQPATQAPPEVNDWLRQNTWFASDKVMAAYATEEHGRLMREMPGLSIEENLKRTREATMEKFPERFGITPQAKPTASQHAPAVEGGGRQAGASSARARGWNDLPPEAKASAEKFIKQDGLFLPNGMDPEAASESDIKKARDAYAKDYWSLS